MTISSEESNPLASYPNHLNLPGALAEFPFNFYKHPQSILLTDSLTPILKKIHPNNRYYIGQNAGIYWKFTDPLEWGLLAPDWFYIPDSIRASNDPLMRSYVVWQELLRPLIILEFADGDGSEERDRTPLWRKGDRALQKPGKFWIYHTVILPVYYGIYEPEKGSIEFYALRRSDKPIEPNERGHYPIPELEAELGIWQGQFQNMELPWLRWWDQNGDLLLTGSERAERAEKLLQQERLSTERLAAQLRTLGVEPEV